MESLWWFASCLQNHWIKRSPWSNGGPFRQTNFGTPATFIEMARTSYRNNDRQLQMGPGLKYLSIPIWESVARLPAHRIQSKSEDSPTLVDKEALSFQRGSSGCPAETIAQERVSHGEDDRL